MSRKPLKFELNPLFSGPTLEARSRTGSPFRELSLDEIDVDPNQPRRVFNAEALSELASSIKAQGVLCPILVKPLPGGSFRLIAGERRLRASKMAGLTSIPAMIDFGNDDTEILPKQLVENIQRQDLTPIERALAVGQLKEKFSWSVREIAERIGISKSVVQRALDILELPIELKQALEQGASESKILLIARVADANERLELLSQIDGLTREEIELRISGDHVPNSITGDRLSHRGTTAERKKVSAEDRRIAEDIQKAIGSRVKILRARNKPGKGKLVLDFYSEDDLRELYRKFVN